MCTLKGIVMEGKCITNQLRRRNPGTFSFCARAARAKSSLAMKIWMTTIIPHMYRCPMYNIKLKPPIIHIVDNVRILNFLYFSWSSTRRLPSPLFASFYTMQKKKDLSFFQMKARTTKTTILVSLRWRITFSWNYIYFRSLKYRQAERKTNKLTSSEMEQSQKSHNNQNKEAYLLYFLH